MKTAVFNVMNHALGYNFVIQGITLVVTVKRLVSAIAYLGVYDNILLFGLFFQIEADIRSQTKIADVDASFTDLQDIVFGANVGGWSHAASNFGKDRLLTEETGEEITSRYKMAQSVKWITSIEPLEMMVRMARIWR